MEAFVSISAEVPVIFPVHPRTVARINVFGFDDQCRMLASHEAVEQGRPMLRCTEQSGYLYFICLLSNARFVLTDSGGIQGETTVIGITCVTLRHNTERPVTITEGTYVLAGTRKAQIVFHARQKLKHPKMTREPKFWDGHAGQRIIMTLVRRLRRCKLRAEQAEPSAILQRKQRS